MALYISPWSEETASTRRASLKIPFIIMKNHRAVVRGVLSRPKPIRFSAELISGVEVVGGGRGEGCEW